MGISESGYGIFYEGLSHSAFSWHQHVCVTLYPLITPLLRCTFTYRNWSKHIHIVKRELKAKGYTCSLVLHPFEQLRTYQGRHSVTLSHNAKELGLNPLQQS